MLRLFHQLFPRSRMNFHSSNHKYIYVPKKRKKKVTMYDLIGDQWWLYSCYNSQSIMYVGVLDELYEGQITPGWVKPLLSVQPIGKYHNHNVAFIYQSCTPCHVLPAAVSTSVRRSIHRLAVPSHRRPLPPCAAAPALNGESPSGGEAETLKDYRERRKEAKHLK